MKAKNFNIRVYGILKNVNGQYLLTDELRSGVHMTKFVGGGLEFNEGLGDALKREFREEMNLEVEVKSLVYINDFLQISKFNPNDQLMSVYYEVITLDLNRVEVCIENPTKVQSFRWVDFDVCNVDDITFPIDKIVFEMLKSRG
jgi:8-oxo-dGTP diphosphatase